MKDLCMILNTMIDLLEKKTHLLRNFWIEFFRVVAGEERGREGFTPREKRERANLLRNLGRFHTYYTQCMTAG